MSPAPRKGRARLFVAADLPADVRDALVAWSRGPLAVLDGLRPVAPEALHVTLCFLGSRAESDVEEIGRLVGEAARPVAPGRVGEARWLPPRRPRVLAVELDDGSGELAALQAGVGAALAEAGFWKPEQRPFLAHVTVARVRTGVRMKPVALAPPPELPVAFETVTVYRSLLSPAGARYEPLARFPLA